MILQDLSIKLRRWRVLPAILTHSLPHLFLSLLHHFIILNLANPCILFHIKFISMLIAARLLLPVAYNHGFIGIVH